MIRRSQYIKFTEQNADPENNENATEFRWSVVQGADKNKIIKVNLIESLQKQADEVVFQ